MSLQKVDTLLELGRHTEALGMLSSLDEEGITPRGHCLRARAYLGLGRYREAAAAAASAIVAAPEHEHGYRLAAIIAMRQGRLKRADQLAERAVTVAPYEPFAHQVATLTAINRNDAKRALRHAEQFLEMAPEDNTAYVTYARALIASGRPKEAEAPLRRALTIEPQDHDAMSLLADVVGKANKDEARELRLAALRTAPHDAEHRRNLLKRGGMATGGFLLVAGKVGFFSKFAAFAMFRHLAGAGTLILGLFGLGYSLAFAVTRLRRHQHGKQVPARVWEGLRADRRNADLLWVAVPAGVLLVVCVPILIVQVAMGIQPVVLPYAVVAALLMLGCWRLRLGDARDLTPWDAVRRIGTAIRIVLWR